MWKIAAVTVLITLVAHSISRAELIHASGNVVATDDDVISTSFGADKASDGINGNNSRYTTHQVDTGGYFDSVTTNPVLVFDLGQNITIDGIAFWAYYNEMHPNSLKGATLRFATDADVVGDGDVSSLEDLLDSANFDFGNDSSVSYSFDFTAQYLTSADQQDFVFDQQVTARYVEMTMTSNYGGNRVGFSEIQFNEAVPEPSALSLAVLGLLSLGLWGWGWHRKQSQA